MINLFRNHSYTILLLILLSAAGKSQVSTYPDQFFTVYGSDSLLAKAEEISGLTATIDGSGLVLADDSQSGYLILESQSTSSPFNRGLPSWNGRVEDDNSGFKVYMRFPYGSGWSPWLTVGFWKDDVWSSYGTTSYGGGWVNIDYVKLNSYLSSWQVKVELKRTSAAITSPAINKLSFDVSDSRTTDQLNYTSILNDNPPEILIPTTFYYQYSLDPNIGSRICSPTTVSMILASYDIMVDPVDFAWDTYDPEWNIFGVWPRVVQNASEYGLKGAVTRYRSWSDTYDVLAQGGRIAMSIGQPLYSGHLVMLAGFDSNGAPIVHDPARSNGYSYMYSKSDISHSWFDKGGVAYTFYPGITSATEEDQSGEILGIPEEHLLIDSYPNPFNSNTSVSISVNEIDRVAVAVYDLSGRKIRNLHHGILLPGYHHFQWNGCDDKFSGVSSGTYLLVATSESGHRTSKNITLLK